MISVLGAGTEVQGRESGVHAGLGEPSRCPFHRMLGISAGKTAEIQPRTDPEAAGRLPIGQALMRRFQDFGVMVAEGISGLTGFELIDRPAQRVIPLIPYDLGLAGVARDLASSPFKGLGRIHAEYGTDAQFLLPTGKRIVFTTDPDITRHILKETDSKNHLYSKGSLMTRASEPVFGADNIVVSSGEAWKSRRRAVSGEFGRTRFEEPELLEKIEKSIALSISELQQQCRDSGGEIQVDLQKEMAIMAMRAFFSAFCSIDELPRTKLEELRDSVMVLLDAFPSEGLNLLPVSLLELDEMIPPLSNLAECDQVFNDFVRELISLSLARKGSCDDMLDIMVHARDAATGEPIEEQVLIEELKTLIVAGFENTGRTLAFCLKELSENPEEYTRVMNEIDAARDKVLDKTSLLTQHLPAVFQNQSEVLRMYPTVFGLTRHALKGDQIDTREGAVAIREGSAVILSPFYLQRREDVFGESVTGYLADKYVPGRWDEAHLARLGLTPRDLSLATFGGGPRVCAGQHFFNAEFQIAVRRYLEAFTLGPVADNFREHLTGAFSLKSDQGLNVAVTERFAPEK